jgi:hypothetical protein
MNAEFAKHFASDWIAAWNSHDLERILSHYADDFDMTSPKIIQLANEPSGTLHGKTAVGNYWAKALQLLPDLQFELINTLIGVNSITLYYRGAKTQLAAEVFHFNSQQQVTRAFAHYLSE